MATGRRSTARIFSVPAIIALIVAFGLISALLGDGIWDAASWIALAVPLAAVAFFLLKRDV
jgi:uncharacterized membrane protein